MGAMEFNDSATHLDELKATASAGPVTVGGLNFNAGRDDIKKIAIIGVVSLVALYLVFQRGR